MVTVAWTGLNVSLPVIDELDEIVRLVERQAPVYVRYSEGPDRDREGPTRDYESGLLLPGLSVTPLNPPDWWTAAVSDWVARRICKYADLMRGHRQPRPWLLTGREVGTGPDHEPLLNDCDPIAWVGPGALADAADVYLRRFNVGRDARSLAARGTGDDHGQVPAELSGARCSFCFPAAITPHQLLLTSEHFHVLALAGQLVEGFLGIMTNACRDAPTRLRCIDDIPGQWTDQLEAVVDVVVRFYGDVYGAPAVVYEHGRGGGARSSLPGGDFVFHPHLCALPGDLAFHEALRARFSSRRGVRFASVRTAIGKRPYVYVHTPANSRDPEPTAYYSTDAASDIENLSMKRLLVELRGIDDVVDWRVHPGEREVASVVHKFNAWYAANFKRHGDPHLGALVTTFGPDGPPEAPRERGPLRILQLAPIWETVPPPGYGGTEAVVHQLVQGLVACGHDVTLWASGDSTTSGKLRSSFPHNLRTGDMLNRGAHDWLHVAQALEDAAHGEYDIVHNHAGELALAFLRLVDVPALSTMHYIPKPDSLPIWDDATGWYNTLSRSHRRGHPPLRRPVHAGYVYHGVDTEAYPFSAEKDDYLLFLSRIAPAKGAHLAVDVARSLGRRLVIAGKVDRFHRVDGPYYSHVVEPLIDGRDVVFEGEVDSQRKLELFRRAQALLLPLQWDEPFGLVMLEAMACGTAVIALNRGAAPEVIAHGATGYVVEDLEQMREAVERVSEIDPYQCRSHVREHFEATIMTERYVNVYREILGC